MRPAETLVRVAARARARVKSMTELVGGLVEKLHGVWYEEDGIFYRCFYCYGLYTLLYQRQGKGR